MTQNLKEQNETTHNDTLNRIRSELEDIISQKDSDLGLQKARITALQKQVEYLENTNEALERKYTQQVTDLKSQYLTTLRDMKEDVRQSKVRSLERLKEAWFKKKTELDNKWMEKIRELENGTHAAKRSSKR